jgi:VanZ family protein
LIFIQSANPSPEDIPSFKFMDKLLHFAAYAVMGILFYRAYQTLKIKDNLRMLMFLSAASAALYGISDEIHQSFVPFRQAEVADVIADTIGAFSGVYLYQLLIASKIKKPLTR